MSVHGSRSAGEFDIVARKGAERVANRVETRSERRRRLGPSDHGLALSMEEYEAAEYEEGFSYELVRGRLEVTPSPDLPHDVALEALDDVIQAYRAAHPGTVDYKSTRSRVFPDAPGRQCSVEPDLALFTGLRRDTEQNWRDLDPVLVVEVLSPGHERKDRVRNRSLYLEVPSIREYWIVDPRRRTLLVLVRRPAGEGWDERLVPTGDRYETPLFPGLSIDLSLPDLGLAALEALRVERLRAEGRAEGRAELLELILEARFGPLPEEARARVRAASADRLVRWAERAGRAGSLDEVFA